MEGPGMSLFQGTPSIHINNSAQDRLEEQEELEDQKRRNEELKHKLANAFDDLLDDDEASSVNSSGNFTLDNQTNGGLKLTRPVPPTYVESLSHLKEQHGAGIPKVYCETPKSHPSQQLRQDDSLKLPFNPHGAGDGQNHYYHQEYRGHHNGMNNFDNRQDYMNTEQLKVMYEMRVKECQQLAAQIEKLDTEIDSLRARLAAAVSDRDKSDLSLQEAHHLLASSKHNQIELEQKVSALTEKLVVSDQEKEQLKLELRSASISLQDVQQRLHTVQVAHSHETDTLFREQQDKHREEVERLQNDLSKAKSRLDDKENQVQMLEKRCLEKDREKEEILIEKGATINRLASELEAAQNKLVSGETARMKERVSQMTAKEQVKELGSKLEVMAHELVLCRNKLAANQKEYEIWRSTLNQILAESLPDNSYVGELLSPGTLKELLSRYKQQLQDEIVKRDKNLEILRKQESELRARLEEHKGIEMQLNSRLAVLQNKLDLLEGNSSSDVLETYKQQNEHLQSELVEARNEIKNLDVKYAELELEHEKLKIEKASSASLAQKANSDLLRELEKYCQQLKDTLKENRELKTLYLQVCSSRETASRELKSSELNLQRERELYKSNEKELVLLLAKERESSARLLTELETSRDELKRVTDELRTADKRIRELQKEFTDKQKEFTDKLNKYLADGKDAMRKEKEIVACEQCQLLKRCIAELNLELDKYSAQLLSQVSNEAFMNELKSKADYFQNYILERIQKLTEQRSVGTNTEAVGHEEDPAIPGPSRPAVQIKKDESLQDGDVALNAETDLLTREKFIRDQIAEKFTLEIKTIEMNCARKIKEVDNEHLGAIAKLTELLKKKAQEVETLKNFVLSERAVVTRVLEAKEHEVSVLIKEYNELQSECQKAKDSVVEWRLKSEQYKNLLSRVATEDLIKIKAKDFRSMMNKMKETETLLAQTEENYDKLLMAHQTLQEKYKNNKKAISTYKNYIAKKDTHIKNELERIQGEYRKIFVNLQNQVSHQVNCRVQEDSEPGSSTQAQQLQQIDYTEQINQLDEELAKLSRDKFEDLDQE